MSASLNHRQATSSQRHRNQSIESALRPQSTQERHRVASPQTGSSDRPQRRTVSNAQESNGASTETKERKFIRGKVTTTESYSVRTRSPTKEDRAEPPLRRHERENGEDDQESHRLSTTEGRRPQTVSSGVWQPHAILIPHTTAPLASRVSIPSLALTAPSSLQPTPLDQLSLERQEAAIIDDLLFIFMGYEGQYIRFVETFDPSVETDRLAGPEFRIAKGLNISLHELTTSMLTTATHYIAVESFIEIQSRVEFGSVNHALCASMRNLLTEYILFITQLEEQYLTNSGFTLHLLHLHTISACQTLSQLFALANEILRKNSMLEEDLEDSVDEFDDVDKILEALREGGDLAPGGMPGKKILRGGRVLGLLTKRLGTISGDPEAKTLVTKLLSDASQPYMTMLNEWLHHGGIRDPHGEFLIREQKSIRRERLEEDYTDEYWEKRYTIRDDEVPPQLEGVKDKVLLAGKYLNVVRECGGVDVGKEVTDVPKTFDDVRQVPPSLSFLENVNGAYAYANSSLLNLLLTTHALPARLRSLKHYFFLDRSDFFSHFLELSASELKKPARAANMSKLQSLLDLVLRQPGTVAAQDPFKEDVKVQMNEVGLIKWLMRIVSVSGIEQDGDGLSFDRQHTPLTAATTTTTAQVSDEDKNITGIAALELDYSVPFPLSLVISRKTVLRYQLLFRYLLSLRHLETQLSSAWNEHSHAASWKHKSSDVKVEMWKRRAWTLRARMLVFVQQLLYFCTSEVIEPNWLALMASLKEKDSEMEGESEGGVLGQKGKEAQGAKRVGRTVDELMQDHVDFLDTCLKECMLTNSKLLKIHSKIITACGMFSSYTSKLTRSLSTADPDLAEPGAYDPNSLVKLSDNLSKYEENFSRHLKILLDVLNYYAATETVRFLGLCSRLSAASEGTAGGSGGA
ncbi:MAG: hypothetical protein M1814_001641 [Vezdaea aestivalis]|nr:MAG: hypothetical protein M1814_001641 [Vezdaea aestivalis]